MAGLSAHERAPTENIFRKLTGLAVCALLLHSIALPAMAADWKTVISQADKWCPDSNASYFPFSKTKVVFGSVRVSDDKQYHRIVNCVRFADGTDSAFDWPAAQLADTQTTKGFISSSVPIDPDEKVGFFPSPAYVGSNRDLFEPKVLRGLTFTQQVMKAASAYIAYLVGSLPSEPRSAATGTRHFDPVTIVFTAELKGPGDASISFLNGAPGAKTIRFRFAPDVQINVPELNRQFEISSDQRTVSYKLDTKVPALLRRTTVTVVNPEGQAIATFPIALVVPPL